MKLGKTGVKTVIYFKNNLTTDQKVASSTLAGRASYLASKSTIFSRFYKFLLYAFFMPSLVLLGCGEELINDKTHVERPFHYEIQKVVDNGQLPMLARDGAGMAVVKGRLTLLPGWGQGYAQRGFHDTGNDIWDTSDLLNWTQKKENTYVRGFDHTDIHDLEGRHSYPVVSVPTGALIIGGDANSGHNQKDIALWDGEKIKRVYQDLPFLNRVGHWAYIRRGCLVIGGGQQLHLRGDLEFTAKTFEESYFTDAAKICEGEEEFTTYNLTADEGFFPAGFTQVAVVGGYAYIAATSYYPTPVHGRIGSTAIYRTNDDAHWEYVGEIPYAAPMTYITVVAWDSHVFFMFGGQVPRVDPKEPESNEMFYLDTRTMEIHEIENVPIPPRHAASAAVFNDELIIGFGTAISHHGGVVNDLWKIVKVYDDVPSQNSN